MKAALFLVPLTTLFLSGVALADAAEYVGGSTTEAVFVAWTSDQSGHLQGQIQVVSLGSTNAASVKRTSAAFTGTRSGSDISLVFGVLSAFSGQTWTGHIGFRTLVLELPTNASEHLKSGSFDDFQRLVARLQGTANSALLRNNAAQSVNDIESQMRSVGKQIINAEADLALLFPVPPPNPNGENTFSHKYAAAWSKMESDWSKEQAQANVVPLTCYEKSQVSYDASQVAYDLSQFSFLDSQFSAVDDRVSRDMTAVTSGFIALRNLYPTYVQRIRFQQQITPGTPAPTLTLASINQAEQNANLILNADRLRFGKLRSTVIDFDQRAKILNDTANAFPDSLTCSG